MSSKYVIVAVIAILAVANAAKLSSSENKDLDPQKRESRLLLEIPLFGVLLLKVFKIIWFLVSKACTIIGYKLMALTLVAKLVSWVFNNSLYVIIGLGLATGVCKLTSLCSNIVTNTELLDTNDYLYYPSKHLENGIAKFSS